MKRVLTPQMISRLNGAPIRLSSPYADGKLLSIDKEGNISLEEIKSDEYDQRWRLVPMGNGGFEIVSKSKGFKICHIPDSGGVVTAIHHACNSTGKVDSTWYLTNEGEIYQSNSLGERTYLWLAGSHLYITQDSFVAEKWSPLFPGEKLPSPVGPQYPGKLILLGLGAVLLLYYLQS